MGSGRALLVGALGVSGVRISAVWVPGTWLWGLDLIRYASLLWWPIAVSPFVVLLPRVARPLADRLASMGDRLSRSPGLAAIVVGALFTLLLLLFPDRSHCVGDYLLRFGILNEGRWNAALFPQAMPLDPFFHFHLPTVLAPILHAEPATVDRWSSAIKAGWMSASGVVLVSALGLRGLPAIVCLVSVACPGSLAIFGGYSKGFVELTLFTAVFAAFGVAALNRGVGLFIATAALALALATHRAAALLVPAWVWLVVASARGSGRRIRLGRLELGASLVVGIAAIAWSAPRILAIASRADRPHFLPGGSSPLGAVALALSPLHLLDVLNALLLMCPLLMLLPVVLVMERRMLFGSAAFRWLGLLALLHAVAVGAVHPKQGHFEDWDVAAAAGVAISCCVGTVLGLAATRRSSPHRMGVALTLATVGPTLIWMSVNASLPRSVERVATYVTQPPPKPAEPLGAACRYLGLVYKDTNRPDEAAAMFARAAALLPTESHFVLWAGYEVERGHLVAAQQIYRTMAERFGSAAAWLALTRCSAALGDSIETERAAAHFLSLRPGDAEALALQDRIRHPRR